MTRVAIAVLAALAGCASTPSTEASDAPVSQDQQDGTRDVWFHDNDLEGEPTVVRPRPGMASVRPHPFAAAIPHSGGHTLRLIFWGGVAPCFVVDRVEVRETRDAVTVTIYAGSDPASPDVACIEIALHMAVDVELTYRLGERVVLDGAPGG